jgi:hypothetical protein
MEGEAELTEQEEAAIDASGGHSGYGEIAFEAVERLLRALPTLPAGFSFADLGSGYGRMVLQVRGLCSP